MSPRDVETRMREVSQLRELQRQRAAMTAWKSTMASHHARDDERRDLDVVSSVEAEWGRSMSATSLDPSHASAWAAIHAVARRASERSSATARHAEKEEVATLAELGTAKMLAQHAARDAAKAATRRRRTDEARQESLMVELRLARRMHDEDRL